MPFFSKNITDLTTNDLAELLTELRSRTYA